MKFVFTEVGMAAMSKESLNRLRKLMLTFEHMCNEVVPEHRVHLSEIE